MEPDQEARSLRPVSTCGARWPSETPAIEELGALEQITGGPTPSPGPDDTEIGSL